jgi:hypothetical protein
MMVHKVTVRCEEVIPSRPHAGTATLNGHQVLSRCQRVMALNACAIIFAAASLMLDEALQALPEQ